MNLKGVVARINGVGWIITLISTIISLCITGATLYGGLEKKIMGVETSSNAQFVLVARQLREIAIADSVRGITASLQLRYLWDEAQDEHNALWKAVHVKPPKRKPYLAPWRRAPDAWMRGEAPSP